jgi:alpha-maltose-1-phosphate synthase
VTVDPYAAAAAYARLLVDPDLRQRLGGAGRTRALQHFTWERVVKAYEQLWREQDGERQAHAASGHATRVVGPPCYPAPDVSFAGYPTVWVGDDHPVCAPPGALDELRRFLTLPLCAYAGQRVKDEAMLRAVLSAAKSPRSLGELAELLEQHGIAAGAARATLAWLLKYGLLHDA